MILIAALFAVISADVFAFAHLNHDCAGEQCAVCSQIAIARNFVGALGCAAAAAFMRGVAGVTVSFTKQDPEFCLSPVTLVSLKTRFNS
jgi:hypothetical protein